MRGRVSPLMDHLVAAGNHRPRAEGRVKVRRLDAGVPAHLLGPGQQIAALLVELKSLLAAAIGHPAVQRDVAVVCLRRLVDGQFGLLRSGGGGRGRDVGEAARRRG